MVAQYHLEMDFGCSRPLKLLKVQSILDIWEESKPVTYDKVVGVLGVVNDFIIM